MIKSQARAAMRVSVARKIQTGGSSAGRRRSRRCAVRGCRGVQRKQQRRQAEPRANLAAPTQPTALSLPCSPASILKK